MSYRAVDVVEESVDLSSGMPVLSARTRTDATIWGARGTWPLSVRMLFAFDGTTWLASSALASVWR